MQTVLIATSVISSLAAAVLCAIVIRLLRDERRRSDARIEALVTLAADPAPRDLPHEPDDEGAAAHAGPPFETLAAGSPPEFADECPPPPSPAFDREPVAGAREAIRPLAAPALLAAESPSPWGRRLAVGGLLALAIAAVAVGSGVGRSADETVSEVRLPPPAAPIQLLSLKHDIDAGALTITGLVQNPRGGRALDDVTAVAQLLDDRGRTVATATAPLDFRRLEAGAESPFVMKVAMSGRVSRYRIGFRDARGAVIEHVDRRSGEPVARRD